LKDAYVVICGGSVIESHFNTMLLPFHC